MTPEHKQAIMAAAMQAGIDPATALAVAERESNFNPNAHSSKTIAGDFQMSGALRKQYGGADADSNEPRAQAAMWSRFFRQNKYEMGKVLGRDPTDEEGYLGHHFGSGRAARMLKMDPNTPVDQVFTPYEMSINPHFGRAGTVGRLNSSVLADMTQKHAKWSSQMPDFSGEAEGAPDKPDFSQFGTLASLNQPPTGADPNMAIEERKFSAPEGTPPPAPTMEQKMPEPQQAPSPAKPDKTIDLAQFGTLAT
jgi:hypothetical protein